MDEPATIPFNKAYGFNLTWNLQVLGLVWHTRWKHHGFMPYSTVVFLPSLWLMVYSTIYKVDHLKNKLDYHDYYNYLNIKSRTEKCKFIMSRAANKTSHDLTRYQTGYYKNKLHEKNFCCLTVCIHDWLWLIPHNLVHPGPDDEP